MDEKQNAAQEWLETATKGIRFGPDRLAVEAELREHLEDGTRIDLDTKLGEDERTTVAYVGLYDYWNIFSRDIRIYANHAPCQIGDWVTVELRFPIGTVTLSAQLSEREM